MKIKLERLKKQRKMHISQMKSIIDRIKPENKPKISPISLKRKEIQQEYQELLKLQEKFELETSDIQNKKIRLEADSLKEIKLELETRSQILEQEYLRTLQSISRLRYDQEEFTHIKQMNSSCVNHHFSCKT